MELRQIILIMLALLLLAGCASETTVQSAPIDDSAGMAVPGATVDEMVVMDDALPESKTFSLTGENFAFFMDGAENPELRVNKGDTVTIEFMSEDGFHDWVVDEFDAATEKVKTGGTTSVTFVADQEGEFEYYCSVGSHRLQGMFGKLIVE